MKTLTNTKNTNNIDNNEGIQYTNGLYPPGYSPYGYSTAASGAVGVTRLISFLSDFLAQALVLEERNLILIELPNGKKIAHFFINIFEERQVNNKNNDPRMELVPCCDRILVAVNLDGKLYAFN